MHNTLMLVGVTHIARVFEGNPRMAGLKQHTEHLAPQLHRWHFAMQSQFTTRSFGFIFLITRFKRLASQLMQVWSFIRREQRPVAFTGHPLHKQIRNPVSGIHIVSTTPLIAGVFA